MPPARAEIEHAVAGIELRPAARFGFPQPSEASKALFRDLSCLRSVIEVRSE